MIDLGAPYPARPERCIECGGDGTIEIVTCGHRPGCDCAGESVICDACDGTGRTVEVYDGWISYAHPKGATP